LNLSVAIFVAAILGLFFLIRAARERAQIQQVFRRLDEALTDEPLSEETVVSSWRAESGLLLERKIQQLKARLKQAQDSAAQGQVDAAIGRITTQVAHDIRSPLTVLIMLATEARELSEVKRSLMRNAAKRIEAIANDLVHISSAKKIGARSESLIPSAEPLTDELLLSILGEIVDEKRVQLKTLPGIDIEAVCAPHNFAVAAKVNPGRLKRVLSNLVNNSIEALSETGSGSIRLVLNATTSEAHITVQDTGPGIEPELLAKLGERGESHGKQLGLGLGVHHAREAMKAWEGTLEIRSTPNVSTEVTLRMPLASPPAWFRSEVCIPRGAIVVLVDDEPLMHSVWRERFKQTDGAFMVHHFETNESFRGFLEKRRPLLHRPVLYFIDQELAIPGESGLHLIKEFGIGHQSTLVTGKHSEKYVLEECARQGISMIPKTLAARIPILTEAPVRRLHPEVASIVSEPESG
jgi:signal transduction histidine kinase